jgi:hypothetical protein
MNRIFGIESKMFAQRFAAILLCSASLVSFASASSDAIVQTSGGVTYVSGGVGKESIDRLSSLARDFNLKLVFAMKSGAYVSGVRVAIADAAGKMLLDTTSEGPWFLAKLPAGNYQVVANFEGTALKKQVAIGAARLRTVDFRWTSASGRDAVSGAPRNSERALNAASVGAESLER